MTCDTSKDTDQPGCPPCVISLHWAFYGYLRTMKTQDQANLSLCWMHMSWLVGLSCSGSNDKSSTLNNDVAPSQKLGYSRRKWSCILVTDWKHIILQGVLLYDHRYTENWEHNLLSGSGYACFLMRCSTHTTACSSMPGMTSTPFR